jgi:hypothetical protein
MSVSCVQSLPRCIRTGLSKSSSSTDCMSLLKQSYTRHCGFCHSFSVHSLWKKPVAYQAALRKDPSDEKLRGLLPRARKELRPPVHGHVRQPSWKPILYPRPVLSCPHLCLETYCSLKRDSAPDLPSKSSWVLNRINQVRKCICLALRCFILGQFVSRDN